MKYINLERIEFPITYLCSGRCKHCQVGDKTPAEKKYHIDPGKAAQAVESLSRIYPITSVMTFGGEPLLYADAVCAIHRKAKECSITHRDIITNGYFSKQRAVIEKVAGDLARAGVTRIMLSVDAFHQEAIPVEPVRIFAEAVLKQGLPIRLHPAWVVDRTHDNRYNQKTKEVLDEFRDLKIEVSNGNNIFLSGDAAKHLSGFYEKTQLDLSMRCGQMPYTSALDDIQTLAIEPNGNVLIGCFVCGNIYQEDIEQIVARYDPYQDDYMRTILTDGVAGLMKRANDMGISVDLQRYHSTCELCRALVSKLKSREQV